MSHQEADEMTDPGDPIDEVPTYPTITPYLLYEDPGAAAEWLAGAFGFTERLRLVEADGSVSHAEIQLGDGVVMLGSSGDSDYRNPRHLRGVTQYLHVYIEDVEAHHAHAAEAPDITILMPPEDRPYGDRSYSAEDPEGHRWTFSQHIEDVRPEHWG
jgi:PhnB protein